MLPHMLMMPPKRQHYVPQCLLKNFSENKIHFNMLNLKAKKAFKSIPLKEQCYENYMYDEDGQVEGALGEIETKFREFSDTLCSLNGVLLPHMRRYASLFVFVQLLRTLSMKETHEKKYDEILDIFLHMKDEYDAKFSDYGFKPDDIMKDLLLNTFGMDALLDDLKLCVIQNKTEDDFILSDNPVVMQDPLVEYMDEDYSLYGFGSRGLQIYMPITPRVCLCLYDKDVYDFKGKNVVEMHSEKDVIQLNLLQMMSAKNNVYYRDPNTDIDYLLKHYQHFCNKNVGKIVRIVEKKNEEYLIRVGFVKPIKIGLRLKIYHTKSNWQRRLFDAQRSGHPVRYSERNPSMARLLKQYRKDLFAGVTQQLSVYGYREEQEKLVSKGLKQKAFYTEYGKPVVAYLDKDEDMSSFALRAINEEERRKRQSNLYQQV